MVSDMESIHYFQASATVTRVASDQSGAHSRPGAGLRAYFCHLGVPCPSLGMCR